ncbi:DUF4381 domain-containing protein [Vibrio sp. HA2012]|uniref:DUF4381 domain-containing protein n=1 Tax=Vibrio sp. HA2012 TaxID=1971595 RepID=UPI000C2CAE89|nr:DUF4381 domain-containing protein [Vibrio sp. HA2012]PJC86964.1 DUF4381 domain-containing protein [Vibrio sp. HA2012]
MTNIASTVSNLLPLKDLHLPAPPGFWPLAWGWWSLLLTMFLTVLTIWLLWRWRKKRLAPKKAAIALLNLERATLTPSGAMEIVRQAALSYYPRSQVAHLSGSKWLDFLDSQINGSLFKPNEREWLQALYEKHAEVNTEALVEQCHHWLTLALPPKRGRRG